MDSGEGMSAHKQMLSLFHGRECAGQRGLCELSAQALRKNDVKLTDPFKLLRKKITGSDKAWSESAEGKMNVGIYIPATVHTVDKYI